MKPGLILMIAGSALLGGCDIYSTTATTDGSVLIVNRFTGAVSKVDHDRLIRINTGPASVSRRHPFTPYSIPKAAAYVSGIAKHVGDNEMLLRMVIQPPPNMLKTESDWERWRSHMERARELQSRIDLRFVDNDQFTLLTQQVTVDTFTPITDSGGRIVEFQFQQSVPISDQTFQDASEWMVGWGAWPAFDSKEAQERPTSSE